MNLVEVWIEDLIDIEKIDINGVQKIKVTFNTVCYGAKNIESRIFNNVDEWVKFADKKYYLG